jgi:hypothetical protein
LTRAFITQSRLSGIPGLRSFVDAMRLSLSEETRLRRLFVVYDSILPNSDRVPCGLWAFASGLLHMPCFWMCIPAKRRFGDVKVGLWPTFTSPFSHPDGGKQIWCVCPAAVISLFIERNLFRIRHQQHFTCRHIVDIGFKGLLCRGERHASVNFGLQIGGQNGLYLSREL